MSFPHSPEKLRVMRLIARLNIGGPAIHTTLLTERLNPEIFASQLVTGVEAENEGHMWELMGARDWQPTIIPSLGREISAKNDMRTLQEVVRLMRREKPHIVHTHTAKAGFVGRAAAHLCHVPVVMHTFHGNVFKGYFSPSKTQMFIRVEQVLATWTNRIIVLGEQQKQEILALGIGQEKQFRIVPLGLDLKPFLEAETLRGQLRHELKIEAAAPIIGIVARLVPIKAIDVFLHAAAKVLSAHPNAVFLVVGDGQLRPELEALAKQLRIDANVRFLGFRSDLPRINADFDCKVLCSHNEGLPVAVIEALAAARPVVATDVGSVKDLVVPGESGVLVAPGDVEALARGIQSVLADREQAARWGQNGRVRVYPKLDISRLVGDIESLYLDAARERGIWSDAIGVTVTGLTTSASKSTLAAPNGVVSTSASQNGHTAGGITITTRPASAPVSKGRPNGLPVGHAPVVNALTIDFEDWYQGLEIPYTQWDGFEDRIVDSGRRLLKVFADADVRATFFVLGYVAEKHPGIVREIVEAGHEIATHGFSHTLVYKQTPAVFREELKRSIGALEEIAGRAVIGHRAPFFSITKKSLWALDILSELGICYDSSIFPVRNYRYGIADAPRWPYDMTLPNGKVMREFPLSTWRVRNRNVPVAGGAYFRLYPYELTRRAFRQINRGGNPFTFYLHPWEIDPDHPVLELPRRIKTIHYLNLAATEKRLHRLVRDFRFAPMREVIGMPSTV